MIQTDHIHKIMLSHIKRKDYKNDYKEENWYLRDLLCDLKHFCDEFGINFNDELERAEFFYNQSNLLD